MCVYLWVRVSPCPPGCSHLLVLLVLGYRSVVVPFFRCSPFVTVLPCAITNGLMEVWCTNWMVQKGKRVNGSIRCAIV